MSRTITAKYWDQKTSPNGVPVDILKDAFIKENGSLDRILVYEDGRLITCEQADRSPEEWREFHQDRVDAEDRATTEATAKAEEDARVARETLAALTDIRALLAAQAEAQGVQVASVLSKSDW